MVDLSREKTQAALAMCDIKHKKKLKLIVDKKKKMQKVHQCFILVLKSLSMYAVVDVAVAAK